MIFLQYLIPISPQTQFRQFYFPLFLSCWQNPEITPSFKILATSILTNTFPHLKYSGSNNAESAYGWFGYEGFVFLIWIFFSCSKFLPLELKLLYSLVETLHDKPNSNFHGWIPRTLFVSILEFRINNKRGFTHSLLAPQVILN